MYFVIYKNFIGSILAIEKECMNFVRRLTSHLKKLDSCFLLGRMAPIGFTETLRNLSYACAHAIESDINTDVIIVTIV